MSRWTVRSGSEDPDEIGKNEMACNANVRQARRGDEEITQRSSSVERGDKKSY